MWKFAAGEIRVRSIIGNQKNLRYNFESYAGWIDSKSKNHPTFLQKANALFMPLGILIPAPLILSLGEKELVEYSEIFDSIFLKLIAFIANFEKAPMQRRIDLIWGLSQRKRQKEQKQKVASKKQVNAETETESTSKDAATKVTAALSSTSTSSSLAPSSIAAIETKADTSTIIEATTKKLSIPIVPIFKLAPSPVVSALTSNLKRESKEEAERTVASDSNIPVAGSASISSVVAPIAKDGHIAISGSSVSFATSSATRSGFSFFSAASSIEKPEIFALLESRPLPQRRYTISSCNFFQGSWEIYRFNFLCSDYIPITPQDANQVECRI